MKYKSNHNLLLPDGKTEVKAGEVFEYDGDISSFAGIIEPVIEPEGKKEETVSEMTEEELRARAKELKIPSAHNMGLKKLAEKVAEKEAEISAAAVAEAEAKEAAALEALKEPDAGFEVDNVPEDPEGDENPKAGENNE
jgi:hypothetical protein